MPPILHTIQENVQAHVQSSPETSQGGEGVQSGLGKMETMPHWEILDEMLAHILWQQPTFSLVQNFFISLYFSCYTKHSIHVTGQINPETGLK